MCGRFTLRSKLNKIVQELDAGEPPHWSPRFNIAPTQPVPIVRMHEDHRQCVLARWGLVPSWTKDLKKAGALINARSDTVAEKPSFRTPFRKRRCLVLADGYYEWKADGKFKQPYLIRLKEEAPFTFAGLWEFWKGDAEHGPIESCTILTTDGNSLTKHIHDRMPVILSGNERDVWLAENAELDELRKLLKPLEPDLMIADAVSMVVNSVKNDVPDCVKPVEME